jgi:hypothetical protein
VQELILHGGCYAVDDPASFQIKHCVAETFGLNVPTDSFVVGSGKLGSSITPRKRWREFGDYSDLDLAIVNHDLYETGWREVDAYRRSGADWPNRGPFEKYLAKGWIRPDYLPASPKPITGEMQHLHVSTTTLQFSQGRPLRTMHRISWCYGGKRRGGAVLDVVGKHSSTACSGVLSGLPR